MTIINTFITDSSPERNRDDSSIKSIQSMLMKKTVGLSKSVKEFRGAREPLGSSDLAHFEYKSMGSPLAGRGHSKRHQDNSEQRVTFEDPYGHGVVDLWLQKNAMKETIPRRCPKSKPRKFKATVDASLITK